MSELGKQLIDKIKLAVGNQRQDNVNYYECEVLAQDDGSSYDEDDYTIRVSIISSKAINNVSIDSLRQQTTDPNNPANELNIQYNDPNNNPNNGNIGQLVFDNVQLMCGVDDGILTIPSIGSRVMVLFSTFQRPFVVQFSAIDSIDHNYATEYNVNVGNSTDSTNSDFEVYAGTMSLAVLSNDNSKFSRIDLTNTSALLTIKDGIVITADTQLSIKNNTKDLKTILDNLVTAINNLVTATGAITVTTSTLGSPSAIPNNSASILAIANNLTTISSDLSALLK